MNGTDTEHARPARSLQEDEVLEQLLGSARARERPAPEVEHRVRAAVEAEWRQLRSKRQRYRRALALAASVAMAALLIAQWGGRGAAPGPHEALAQVIERSGRVAGEGPDARPIASGALLHAGTVVRTGSGSGTSLAWNNGIVLRLGEQSRLGLTSAGEVELLRGRVYLDARPTPDAPGGELVVRTAVGEVTHIGTQYLAELAGDQLEVTVREGRVRVRANEGGEEAFAARGMRIRLPADGPVTKENAPTYGGQWAWVEALAPPYEIEGSSAWDFLNWVGRETGRSVTFQETAAEQAAIDATLHGSVNLPPMEAMQLILQTTDLEAAVRDQQIVVRLRR